MRRSRIAVGLVSGAVLLACGARTTLPIPRADAGDAADTGGTGGAGGEIASSSSGGAGGEIPDGGVDAGPEEDAGFPPIPETIWASSGQTLYVLDPASGALQIVGSFQGCAGSVIDLAASASGRLYATTSEGFFSVDPVSLVCTFIASGTYPNSLAVVPPGGLDPTEEAIVGYEGELYVRIDPTTGNFDLLGTLGPGGLVSSGDMVVLPGGRAFLTVNGDDCDDCLVEVDTKSGVIVRTVAHLAYSSVWGLASSLGRAFGLSADGSVFQVDLTTGETTALPLVGAPAGISFYGAASRPAAAP